MLLQNQIQKMFLVLKLKYTPNSTTVEKKKWKNSSRKRSLNLGIYYQWVSTEKSFTEMN